MEEASSKYIFGAYSLSYSSRVKAHFANRPVKTALVIKSLFDRIDSGYQFDLVFK